MFIRTFLLLWFCSIICYPQSNFSDFDDLLDNYLQTDAFNGTILIAENGQILYQRSLGYADFENQIILRSTTPMHLASISKTFTVMAVMIMKERGLLHYDDSVSKYLTSISYGDMTIRHLMASASGLKRLYNQAANGNDIISIDGIVDFVISKKPRLQFSPGSEFQSSIVGYCLLASIIEKVSGKRFGEFLEDEIFIPLKMADTFLLTRESWSRKRAISYDRKNKEKEWYLGSYNGGVGIYSSAEDLLSWDQALYSDKLVSKETVNESFKPFTYTDGTPSHVTLGGWMRWKGQKGLIFKNGDWVANNAILFRDIERKVTVIVMNNRQNKVSKFDLMDKALTSLGYTF